MSNLMKNIKQLLFLVVMNNHSWMTLDLHYWLLGLGILAYIVYYYFCAYFYALMKGDYNTSKKNRNKHLPPYPNGWYILCKSNEIPNGSVKSFDISGHNIAVFRSTKGEVYALQAYCLHMGANLGVGGKVVNDKCIQCPFHGWLYDGETGHCVDHDGKNVTTKTLEYEDDFGGKNCKSTNWKQGSQQQPKLIKYKTMQMNTFVYVWLHSDLQKQPYFTPINTESWIGKFSNRGRTEHIIRCHLQDIPENGADTFHFKYVHKYLIGKFKMLEVSWSPQWKRGDDPTLPQLFEHKHKNVRIFKQAIYKNIVENLPNKQYYSFGTVDNYLMLPIFGKIFHFNITIIQAGPGLVNVFLKSHFYEILFTQFVQSTSKFQQRLVHEMFTSNWLPYWLTAAMLYGEGIQVYYDMTVWDAKKPSYKLYYKDNEADDFIKSWRGWVSQHYEGCDKQLTQSREGTDW